MLDSGCSWHMTPDGTIFTSIIPYRKAIWIANGQRIYSKGLGNVEIDVDGKIVKMSNVLHVSYFESNILSISALNAKGLDVLYRQSGIVEILRKDICVATGVLCRRTYYLETSQVALASIEAFASLTSENTVSINPLDPKPTNTWLWYSRLGHISPCRLQSLDLNFEPQLQDFWCTVCDFTKLTRSINTSPLTKRIYSIETRTYRYMGPLSCHQPSKKSIFYLFY